MKRNFLFSFNFNKGTIRDECTKFFMEHKIDYFEQLQTLYADVFSTGEYYKIDYEGFNGGLVEIYYYSEYIGDSKGWERKYPLIENGGGCVRINEPVHSIIVKYDDGNTTQTAIRGCKDTIMNYYIGSIFNFGTEKDDLHKCTEVSFLS